MLVLFHTAKANEQAMAALLKEIAPEIPSKHIVQSEWLEMALVKGGVSAANFEGARDAMRKAK
jgi:hypothetical protein